MMSGGSRFAALVLAGMLFLPAVGFADAQHRAHKAKKQQLPPPLPSGPQGPVQQVPLDAIPTVAPQVTYQNGQLTIVASNSTLGDILRAVRKHTSAEIDIPANATERVVTNLGPGPARVVVAQLLNGSRFNYVLLGSPQDSTVLARVVLVAKSGPDTVPNSPSQPPADNQAQNNFTPPPPQEAANMPDAADDNADDNADDTPDQGTAEAEQPAPPQEQPGVKSPQQLLQEMQQRQLQMQQQQQTGQPGTYPVPPGMPVPQRPPQEQQ